MQYVKVNMQFRIPVIISLMLYPSSFSGKQLLESELLSAHEAWQNDKIPTCKRQLSLVCPMLHSVYWTHRSLMFLIFMRLSHAELLLLFPTLTSSWVKLGRIGKLWRIQGFAVEEWGIIREGHWPWFLYSCSLRESLSLQPRLAGNLQSSSVSWVHWVPGMCRHAWLLALVSTVWWYCWLQISFPILSISCLEGWIQVNSRGENILIKRPDVYKSVKHVWRISEYNHPSVSVKDWDHD